jgi:hypothetical protein
MNDRRTFRARFPTRRDGLLPDCVNCDISAEH